jgi:hypothetical protein
MRVAEFIASRKAWLVFLVLAAPLLVTQFVLMAEMARPNFSLNPIDEEFNQLARTTLLLGLLMLVLLLSPPTTVVVLHLAATAAMFYLLGFTVKNLIMAERQAAVTFFDYSGPFFAVVLSHRGLVRATTRKSSIGEKGHGLIIRCSIDGAADTDQGD